jgi:uncharacterized alpha-E superfamily protein
MERAENTARLVNVYTNLLLDMPVNSKVSWQTMMTITGSEQDFSKNYSEMSEGNVINYLIKDKSNYASLCSSIKFARENARTTRDILPSEVWNVVNEAYLLANENMDSISSRTARYKFLNQIIECGQIFEGIISSGMSRNDTYRFFVLGRLLERADMVTRILDVGSRLLSSENDDLTSYKGIVWMNLLKSISAYLMYRQIVKRRVTGEGAIQFLILDKEFPRSVWYCAETISRFAAALPNNENVQAAAKELQKFISSFNFSEIDENKIHCFMDEIQKQLIIIGDEIDKSWFNTEQE